MFCSAVSHTVRYAHSLANRLELPEVVVQLAFGSHRTAMHIHEASRPIDNLRSARSESRLVCGYRRVDRTAAAPERAGGCAANAPPARACDLHADGGLKRRGLSDGLLRRGVRHRTRSWIWSRTSMCLQELGRQACSHRKQPTWRFLRTHLVGPALACAYHNLACGIAHLAIVGKHGHCWRQSRLVLD